MAPVMSKNRRRPELFFIFPILGAEGYFTSTKSFC
jgi:hypothetical protein